jgi:hypothetical protein
LTVSIFCEKRDPENKMISRTGNNIFLAINGYWI